MRTGIQVRSVVWYLEFLLALHVADLSTIPSTTYSPQSTLEMIPGQRAKNKPCDRASTDQKPKS